MLRHRALAAAFLLLAIVSLPASPASAQPIEYETTALGSLGGSFTSPLSINDSGEVAGYGSLATGRIRGFYWSEATGIVAIGPFTADSDTVQAFHINAQGAIAGRVITPAQGQLAWVRHPDGLVTLVPTALDATVRTNVIALSDSGGLYASEVASGVASRSYHWSASTGRIEITYPGSTSTTIFGANDAGVAIGIASGSFGARNFTWTALEGFVDLAAAPPLPPCAGQPSFTVHNDVGDLLGICVTGPSGTNASVFHSDATGFVLLDNTGNTGRTTGTHLNNLGEVLGVYLPNPFGADQFPFHWSADTGIVDITPPGVNWLSVVAFTDSGGALMQGGGGRNYVWTSETGPYQLFSGAEPAWAATAMNEHGQIVGTDVAGTALLWTPIPTNTAPVAVDDFFVIDEDTVGVLHVVGNDFDAEGDSLMVTEVGEASHGSVTTDGSLVTYTPAPNFVGTEQFTYVASDGELNSNTAVVTVQILPVNDPPTAVDDSVKTPEGTSVEISVLANDIDIDREEVSLVSATDGAHGRTSLNSRAQTILYIPDPGFFGTDQFTYTIADPKGLTASALVRVLVLQVNEDPVAVDDSAFTDVDGPLVIDVLANDVDPDGDPLQVIAASNGAHGSVTDNGDGSVTYQRDPGFNGTDAFTYTVGDGGGGEASALVSVTVLVEVNLPPGASVGPGTTLDPSVHLGQNASIGANGSVGAGTTIKQGAGVGDNATIGADANVGSNATVGDNFVAADGANVKQGAQVGNDVSVGVDATVGVNAVVGDGTTLDAGAHVKQGAEVGADVVVGVDATVGAGASVGDGSTVDDGAHVKQGATVGAGVYVGVDAVVGEQASVGDGVSIGAGSHLKQGSSVGAGAQIGANVVVGKGVLVGAGASIGDGTTIKQGSSIGAGAIIGAGVVLKQNVTVGINAIVADGTVVPKGTVIPDGALFP